MNVFKFGGASVKDAEAVRNIKKIIESHNTDQLIVVVSAMGKTTNALENIFTALYNKDYDGFDRIIQQCKSYHKIILNDLFDNKTHPIYSTVDTLFESIQKKKDTTLSESFGFEYDQLVSLGEVISTQIIAAYLSLNSNNVVWADARKLIRTDNHYRAGIVNWEKTTELIEKEKENWKGKTVITQGFIAHTKEGFTTTLGREGSDYTGSVLAYCTNAESLTIWKDVPGMLNADPKWFDDTTKLDKISYKETIELAYYGASVIHPKTIKPLQNKNIPLYIKSFVSPETEGTVVCESQEYDGIVPSYIFKVNQILLSITPKDFSFIVEENLSDIFKQIAISGGHINIMQTSAVSFTACLDIKPFELKQLIKVLESKYRISYNNDLELVTIRHYNQSIIDKITQNKDLLMEQRTRYTTRIVMRKKVDLVKFK